MITLRPTDLAKLAQQLAVTDRRWNVWIKVGKYGDFYLRRSFRKIEDHLILTLDMASAEINQKYRGQGIYTQVMEYIEKHTDAECLFHESVLNRRLGSFLVRKGYRPYYVKSCYYKLLVK